MNPMPAGLVVFGFGGHARSVADVAFASGIRQFIFIDETAGENETLCGSPVRRIFDERLPDGWQTFAASGDNRMRQAQVANINANFWPLATLISPTATIGRETNISAGCFVGHHAHIGPHSTIGTACIVNTGAVIDHECEIGNYTHVSVNSSVAGRCRLGNFVFLGAGAVVIDKLSVSDSITIGAGGVVVHPLTEPGVYIGIPARPMA